MTEIELMEVDYKQISKELRAIGFELSSCRDGAWEKVFSDTFSMGVRILPSELQFYRWGDSKNDFSFHLSHGRVKEAIVRIKEINTFTELDWIQRGKVLEREIDELLEPVYCPRLHEVREKTRTGKSQRAQAQRFLYPRHPELAQSIIIRLKLNTVEIRFV